MALPNQKVGGYVSRLPRLGAISGNGGSGGGGATPTPARASAPPSLSSLFSGLGIGGGGGAPGGGNTGYSGAGGGVPSTIGTSMPGSAPLSLTAPENPNLAGMAGKFGQLQNQWSQYGSTLGQYGKDLASSNDLAATQAMQRQRDAMSGVAKEYGANAAARGISGSGAAGQDLINKVTKPGQQQLTQLNEDLTNQGRQQQFNVLGAQGNALQGQGSALGGQQGAANSSANWQQAQQNLGLEAWKAQQNNMLAQWQLQNQQQNQGVNQMLALIGAVGNMYSGF